MSAPLEVVYGRRPLRETVRAGRRRVVELAVSDRALATEPWLGDIEGVRPRVTPERELAEIARSRDHQGVVARCEPYRYEDAWELAAGETPLLVCLDGVTDPHNLGAVCRSAEGAGVSGLVLPEHASARVSATVCKASAGAVEHLRIGVVVNLARYLSEIKRGDLWVWAAEGGTGTPLWQADLAGGVVLVLGAEGKGIRPGVRRRCDAAVSIPLAGCVESLNVSVAAGVLLFEALRQRGRGGAG